MKELRQLPCNRILSITMPQLLGNYDLTRCFKIACLILEDGMYSFKEIGLDALRALSLKDIGHPWSEAIKAPISLLDVVLS